MTPKLASNVLLGLPTLNAIAEAGAFLRAHGFTVTPPGMSLDEHSIGALCRRFGLGHGTIHKRLHHPRCPRTFRRLGPRGRIVAICLSPELETWLSQPRQPGRKLCATEVQAA